MWKIIKFANYHLLISGIFFSITLMLFSPNGSISPMNREFYLALCGGLVWIILTKYGLNKIMPNLQSRISNSIKFSSEFIHSSIAHHFKRWEGVGGKLFLTDKQLIFKSHRFNIQNHEEEFDLIKIDKVESPKGKRLNFEYEGKLENFIVEEPEKWVEKLKSP